MLGVALIVCAAVYVPGLYGSFVYDDSTFIIANVDMHVKSLRLGDWAAAAFSFPSSHQGRWLGMLSFAANHYLTGLDPYWLKATNLGIHLVNGVLVFAMFRALFALWRETLPDISSRPPFDNSMASAALAGVWLLLPINLTAVLYVSQRLESLSTTFVFLGLWWYARARLAHWQTGGGIARLWLSVLVPTGVGVLVKESAAMLPLFAFCIELAITQGRNRDGRRSRPLYTLYFVLLGVPLVVGCLWLATWVGGNRTYARSFTTVERLLSEARVLVDYIRWTLAPQPEALTLFHDDIVVSRGLFAPPTTALACAGLAALLGAAIWQRSRRPLFSLGVFWFFAGHLLTGTLIPLLLAFEHRNYFPSVGLLLAGASLATLEGGLRQPRFRVALVCVLATFYAFSTWMRAEEWSDPLRLALSEANKRPQSSSAQYELGRVFLNSYRKGESEPMTKEAFEVLERGARLPNSDILHEQLLIVSHAQLKQPIDPAWWESLLAKLRQRTPTTSDIAGLMELESCYAHAACNEGVDNLRLAFEAAVAHASPNGVLLSSYGEFAEKILGASDLAEKQFRAALAVAPSESTIHANLVTFLIHHRRFEEARTEIVAMRRMNYFGALDGRIAALEASLREAQAGVPSAPPNATMHPSPLSSQERRT